MPSMKPRISFITLTVDNLEQAVAFYRDGLGWPTEGIIGEQYENGAAAFFKLENNLMFALWPRQSLANDSGLPLGKAEPTHVLLALLDCRNRLVPRRVYQANQTNQG